MKIYLEKINEKDAKKLFQFEAENRCFFETMVPSRGDHYYQYGNFLTILLELLKEQSNKLSLFYLIKDEREKIVGRMNLVDINIENRSCSIGYRIGESFLKKGIATQALKEVLKEAEKLQIYEIAAKTTFDNIGSQKVLENNGFTRIFDVQDDVFVHYVWKSLIH